MGQDFNLSLSMTDAMPYFSENENSFFYLIMNQTSKPPCATNVGASFPLNKVLLQCTKERVCQLSCSVD